MELEPVSPPPPAPTHKHSFIKAALALLFVVQIIIACAFYLLWVQDPGALGNNTSEADTERLEAIEEQLEAVGAEISSLHNRIGDLENSLSDLESQPQRESQESLNTALETLESRLAALESAPQNSGESFGPVTQESIERFERMQASLSDLQKQIETSGAAQWQTIRLLTSFDRLEERVLSGAPYDQALEAFRLAAASLPESTLWVQQLDAWQFDGVPSSADIVQRFSSAREAALNAHQPSTGQASLWREVQKNLGQLVRIRKTGADHEGSDLESVLARAEYALMQQEHEQCKSEIALLAPELQAYFEEVIGAINGRSASLATLEAIRSHLMTQAEVR